MRRMVGPVPLLLLLAEIVSFALYWPVVAIDAGWLESTDTRLYLDLIRADPRPIRFLDLHIVHFLPVQRFIHWGMWGLFGPWWTPWGLLYVALHGFLAALAGLLVWTFGRSVVAAAATVVVVAVSSGISTGVLLTFANSALLIIMSLVLLSPVLVHRWMRQRPVRLALAAYLISLWCVLSYIPGAIGYAMLSLAYAGLWATRRPLRIERADALFFGALVTSALTYLALYLPMLAAAGWTLPTDLVLCEDTTGRSQAERFAEYTAFWFGQVVLPAGVLVPFWNVVFTGLVGVGTLASFGLAVSGRVASSGQRSALVIVAVCLTMSLLGAAMLAAGRPCVQLWHMRYNLYVSVLPAPAVGILAGLVLAALPRGIAAVAAALLIFGASLVVRQNVNVVLASPWMTERAPGFVKSPQSSGRTGSAAHTVAIQTALPPPSDPAVPAARPLPAGAEVGCSHANRRDVEFAHAEVELWPYAGTTESPWRTRNVHRNDEAGSCEPRSRPRSRDDDLHAPPDGHGPRGAHPAHAVVVRKPGLHVGQQDEEVREQAL